MKTYKIFLQAGETSEVKPYAVFKVRNRYFGVNRPPYQKGWVVTDILSGYHTGSRFYRTTAKQALIEGPAFMEDNFDRIGWDAFEIINPEWLP
jgi:hypothetical protein